MFRQLISQIRLRYLNLVSKTSSHDFTDEQRLLMALTWFRQTLLPGGGSSAKYSMMFNKWFPSYPETTAFWINTLIYLKKNYPTVFNEVFQNRPIIEELTAWLINTQRKDGTFPGSYGDFKNQPPRVFNNGQIVLALVDYYNHYNDSNALKAAQLSADWILKVQDDDGAWRQFTLHQLSSNTRTAWALIKLGQTLNENKYQNAGIRNIEYALQLQNQHDYFTENGFDENEIPTTHTIGYALRGIVGAAMELKKNTWIEAVERSYLHIVERTKSNGYLPGELDEDWKSDTAFCCLTGNCQLSVVGFLLTEQTGKQLYADTAIKLLQYVKERQLISQSPMIHGGISGSWPVNGGYCAYDIPNWAAKFFADALMFSMSGQK
jgi:hypothetical protein